MEWFRSWHGAPTDTKFLVVARRAQVAPGMVSAVYWALLDHASQNNPRGSIAGFDTEAYAAWSGWEEDDVIAIIAAFVARETIKDDMLTAWEKRQPKREDNSTPRVKRYRDNHRGESVTDDDVTHGNAVKRNVTQSNHRSDSEKIDRTEDERSARPPAEMPTVDTVPEFAKAIAQFREAFKGDLVGVALQEFTALWPDLTNGKREWIGDAIEVAKSYHARTPAYAVRVLVDAVRDNKRPGQAPERPAKRGGYTPEPGRYKGTGMVDGNALFEAEIAAEEADRARLRS